MSAPRHYFGDRSRDRPNFNYNRREERPYIGNIPASRHSIFIRGFPASVSTKHIKNFFIDETRSDIEFDFISYTDEHRKLCIAVRFPSSQIAKDIYMKFNNREILGHKVEFSWYKDMKSVKGKYNDRNFRGSYNNSSNNNNRIPRRFNERRSRSKPRNRESEEKRREFKSRSRSKGSRSSSSYSKSRSGSDSLSDRSSASPTRLIRTINKEKYNRRHTSEDSSSSKDRSRGRNETKSDVDIDRKKTTPRNSSSKVSEGKDNFHKSFSTFEALDDVSLAQGGGGKTKSMTDQSARRLGAESKSVQLLEKYSDDIEKYSTVVDMLINKDPSHEGPLLDILKDILTDLGSKYVNELISFVETSPGQVAAH